ETMACREFTDQAPTVGRRWPSVRELLGGEVRSDSEATNRAVRLHRLSDATSTCRSPMDIRGYPSSSAPYSLLRCGPTCFDICLSSMELACFSVGLERPRKPYWKASGSAGTTG